MIVILSATEDEISYFLKRFKISTVDRFENLKIYKGSFFNSELIVGISGIGLKKAKNATNIISTKYNPSLILSVGVSGALNPSLRVGDVIVGEQVMSLARPEKYSLFSDFPHTSPGYKRGKILSENKFINLSKEKEGLYKKSGADCVDMESWGIANIVKNYKIKVSSIRAISDDSTANLPRMEKLYNKESKFQPMNALRYFSVKPHEILSFIRFRYFSYKKAKVKLNDFLRCLLLSFP